MTKTFDSQSPRSDEQPGPSPESRPAPGYRKLRTASCHPPGFRSGEINHPNKGKPGGPQVPLGQRKGNIEKSLKQRAPNRLGIPLRTTRRRTTSNQTNEQKTGQPVIDKQVGCRLISHFAFFFFLLCWLTLPRLTA